MTNPKENEELNEELSSDELKGVNGGQPHSGGGHFNPQGSGSGMSLKDWKKSRDGMVSDVDHPGTLQMTQGLTNDHPGTRKRDNK